MVTTDQKSWNFFPRPRPRPRTWLPRPRPRPRTPLAGLEAPRGQGHVLEDSISGHLHIGAGWGHDGQRPGPAQLCTERTTAGLVRIFAEPQTAPTAQKTVDYCRQSAAFCRSEMTAPSQGLSQSVQQQITGVPAAWSGRRTRKLLRGPAASPADHLLPPACRTSSKIVYSCVA